MVFVNVITAISVAVLMLLISYMVIGYAVRGREERINFIRSFKKGKCLVIYLLAIPLYTLGRAYQGAGVSVTTFNVLEGFFRSLSDAVSLVVMKFNVEDIALLMADNLFYRYVIYSTFVLVIMNTLLFWFSVAGQHFWSFRRDIQGKLTKKDLLYILGYSEESLYIYNSDAQNYKFIVGDISKEDAVELYAKMVAHYSSTKYTNYIDVAFNKAFKGNQKVTIIVNTGDDEINLKLLGYVSNKIEKLDDNGKAKLFNVFRVYGFGSLTLKAVYDDVVSDSYGFIEYVNSHQKVAVDFIDKYAFASFATDKHIDYETSLVKKGVDINCVMVGFGKTNRQILLTSVANNHFMTATETGIKEKPVNYCIFDKTKTQNNKNLNHDYYRYKNEFVDVNENDYLPLPTQPSNEEYCNVDIESNEFYAKLKQVVGNKNDLNFIIVAFGTDLENIDMAQKIIEKKLEWGVDNLYIFVRAKSWRKQDTLLEQEECFFIGNSEDVVYNYDKITNDKTFKMAIMRNQLYHYEKMRANNKTSLTKQERDSIDVEYIKKWFVKNTQLERESGIYCLLSLRSKLNLMGLDYVSVDADGVALSEEEYLSIYAKNDMPKTVISSDGVKLISYDLDFKKSMRRNLAEQEHQRWNAFMLSKGVIPATKWQILNETKVVDGKTVYTNGKNYKLRRHGNLTTFDGLVEFRKMIAKRDGVSEEVADVFKYDYQILDEAHSLLTALNYKIIKKA
ncbi:MAG: hypothetical protein J6R88_06115 [Clostridia bacterium]|nr:hypothetical protein [Clostridia bacterium]